MKPSTYYLTKIIYATAACLAMLSIPLRATLPTVSASYSHSLYVTSDGTLWAMGRNYEGQLGDGTTTTRTSPVQVTTDVTAVAAGYEHSLFVKSDGTLWAMGWNYYGQLGDGTTTTRTTPVQVTTDVIAVAAGYDYSLFVKSDGTLWAMGNNGSGQLGDGTTSTRTSPVQVATDVTAVAAGWIHSLFIKSDGTLWAMGSNYLGQLGDGTSIDRTSPVQVTTDAIAVAAGYNYSLFIKSDGTLWAMGYNYYGQLGDGTTTDRSSPVQVATDVTAAAAGYGHSLFVKSDDTLWAMGYNFDGILGDGTTTDRSSPAQVATDVTAAAAGESHSLFVKSNGTLWAVGFNYYGELGDGTTTTRTTPVLVASDLITTPTPTALAPPTLPVGAKIPTTTTHPTAPQDPPSTVTFTITTNTLAGGTLTASITGTRAYTYAYTANADTASLSIPEVDNMVYSLQFTTPTTGTLTLNGTDEYGPYQEPGTFTYTAPPAPTYALTLNNATAIPAGPNAAGTTITLTANPAPAGQVFDKWTTSNGGAFANPTASPTTFTMPAAATTITATYRAAAAALAPTALPIGAKITFTTIDTAYPNDPPATTILTIATTNATGGTLTVAGTDSNGSPVSGTYVYGYTATGDTGILTVPTADNAVISFQFTTPTTGTLTFRGTDEDGPFVETGTFTYTPPPAAPTITAVSTTTAKAGDTIIINGANLTGATVTIGGMTVPAANVSVSADGATLTFTVPANAITGAIVITPPAGDSVTAAPILTITATQPPLPAGPSLPAVAAGDFQSLYVTSDGSLWAMGANYFGQLGDSTITDRNAPVQVASNVTAIAGGSDFSVYVSSDGELWGMGYNGCGVLGKSVAIGSFGDTPAQVTTATNVIAVSAGSDHILYLTNDGKLWGMGNNSYGQLGTGSSDDINHVTPVQVASNVTAFAAGSYHSLYVTGDGKLWALGNNDTGQLGIGSSDTDAHATPVQVQATSNVTTIAAGYAHSLYATSDGTLWGMGRNWEGELGDSTDTSAPVQITSNVTAIAVGDTHSLYVTSDGKLHALGGNDKGQLGIGSSDDNPHTTPAQVATGVIAIAANAGRSFYVTSDGELWAMGWNNHGQLGDGSNTDRHTPVLVARGLVGLAPVITTQPASQTVTAGNGTTFSVVATGGNLAYEWQKNGVTIPGATGSMYAISNVQPADAGNYRVIVSNQAGSDTSTPATLTVNAASTGGGDTNNSGGGGGAPSLLYLAAAAALLMLRAKSLPRIK